MSISETLTLPAQPSAGLSEYIPLGGDGWAAPQSAYMIDMQITGDASGGTITFIVLRDERFEQIVNFLQVDCGTVTAQEYSFGILRKSGITIHQIGVAPEIRGNSNILWTPPTMIDPIRWEVRVDNRDTEVDKFRCLVYNFNIRASEKVPLPILVSSLPRSPSAI